MRTITHVVASANGLNTTRAGLMAQHAKAYRNTTVSVSSGNQTARTTQILRLLGMNFSRGRRITVVADGPHEDLAIADMRRFLDYYL